MKIKITGEHNFTILGKQSFSNKLNSQIFLSSYQALLHHGDKTQIQIVLSPRFLLFILLFILPNSHENENMSIIPKWNNTQLFKNKI